MSSTSTTKTTKTLTVVKREVFYDDSFFKDCWNDYDSAVKNVLQNFEPEAKTETKQLDLANRNNCTDVYRQIRTKNIDSDLYKSQALQITENEGNFQCVMDVKDFDPNLLQVKVVENRVMVDGKFEKKSADGMSSSSKSFHKEFTLPSSANIESITTALSRDGVLTIKAPKRDAISDGAAVVPSSNIANQTSQSLQESSSQSVSQNSESNLESRVEKKETKTVSSKSTFSSTKTVSMTSGSIDMLEN